MSELKKIIEQAFENRNQINAQTKGEIGQEPLGWRTNMSVCFLRFNDGNDKWQW